jgi:hypothetical protein
MQAKQCPHYIPMYRIGWLMMAKASFIRWLCGATFIKGNGQKLTWEQNLYQR